MGVGKRGVGIEVVLKGYGGVIWRGYVEAALLYCFSIKKLFEKHYFTILSSIKIAFSNAFRNFFFILVVV